MDSFPEEVVLSPLPFIGLIGLESSNPQHALIWKTFAIDRAKDRFPVYYKLLPANHQYPVFKAKKNYAGYSPEGILKTHWLRKHMLELPSVVLVFQEVTEQSIDSAEFVSRCKETVDQVKASLYGRQTKVVLVLVQSTPLSPTQMPGYKESAARLCTECDIDRKCLFVISTDEQQIGRFVVQIEQILFELVKTYFMGRIAEVKSHKEQLNKTLQISLFVRHEFKIGFYNEVRQLYKEALIFYKNAYVSLMEMKVNALNVYELKTISSLLNYKICKMSFFANLPMDAFSHFQKHLSISKTNFATSQEYEHQAWLSEQCSIFACLFEIAINTKNLEPLVTQYPGMYHLDAINFCLERRESAASIEKYQEFMPNLDQMLKSRGQNFVGQFVFFQQCSDQDKVNLILHSFLFRESFIDYSSILIGHYETVLRCIDQYIKNYKKNEKFEKNRLYIQIKLSIANEYYNTGNFVEALKYYKKVMTFFKKEQWPDIVASFLPKAILSSLMVVDINNYVKLVLESFAFEVNDEFKLFRQTHFEILLKMLSFEQHEELTRIVQSNTDVQAKWQEFFQRSTFSEIVIPLSSDEIVKCKVAFSKPEFDFGEKIEINVAILSKFDVSQGASLSLRFQNSHYDQFCKASKVCLSSESATHSSFNFYPKYDDAKQGQELRIIEAFVVFNTRIPVRFVWQLQKEKVEDLFKYLRVGGVGKLDKFRERFQTKVLRVQSKLALQIDSYDMKQAFCGEKFVYRLKLHSNEKHPISKVKLTLKASLNNQNDLGFQAFIFHDNKLAVLPEKLDVLEHLDPQGEQELKVLVSFPTPGSRQIEFHVCYDLQDVDPETGGMRIVSPEVIETRFVGCVESLTISSSLSNIGSDKSAFIRAEEPFKLELKFGSQNETLQIARVQANLNESFQLVPSSTDEFPVEVDSKNLFAYSLRVVGSQPSSSLCSLGSACVFWVRSELHRKCGIPLESLLNRTVFSLPSSLVYQSDVFIELQLPQVCYSRNALLARYKIHNRSEMAITTNITMGNSELFMIAGNKSCKVQIGARESNEQLYTFLPLLCGELQLPKIGIRIEKGGQLADVDYVEQMISSSVYVLPQLRSLN